MKKENVFQSSIKQQLFKINKDIIVLKNDPEFYQGIPDLIILYNNKWAALECKRTANASIRPNQQFYINLFNKMSYAAFIYPENREEVINELCKALGVRR